MRALNPLVTEQRTASYATGAAACYRAKQEGRGTLEFERAWEGFPDGREGLAFAQVLAKIANVKQVSASHAKNNFGGLLDDVAALGCVEIVKHGRPVAVILSPRALEEVRRAGNQSGSWGETHMIPADRARAAQMVRSPSDFDDE